MTNMAARNLSEINAIQDRTIDEAVESLILDRAVLIEAPTGAGKTRMTSVSIEKFAENFEQVNGRKPYVLALQHRDHLAHQSRAAFSKWNPQSKLTTSYSAGGTVDDKADINFAVIDTLAAQLAKARAPDLISIDETHHASEADGARYNQLLNHMLKLNPDLAVMGATGTPSRPDEKGLHESLRKAPTTTVGYGELERAGQIILPETIVADVDMKTGVGLRTEIMNFTQKNKTLDGIGHYVRENRDEENYRHDTMSAWSTKFADTFKKAHPDAQIPGTLVFTEDRESAAKFLEAANGFEDKLRVGIVDSSQSSDKNTQTLKDYADGKIDIIVSVKMLDEGIDIPRTRCVILDRPSTSETEYHQMIGRAMRKGDDPELSAFRPVVIDAGASTAMHGRITDRARVIDYIQDVVEGKIQNTFGFSREADRQQDTAHSNWNKVMDRPETFAITDGKNAYYLRQGQGNTYNLAVVLQGKKPKSQAGAVTQEFYRNISATQVRNLEKDLYKGGGRLAVLALEATFKGEKTRADTITKDRKNLSLLQNIFEKNMKGVER